MTVYSLTISELKTESVYRAVFKELMGADEPEPFNAEWHTDVSVDVSACELVKHLGNLSVIVPSVRIEQITIEPFERKEILL